MNHFDFLCHNGLLYRYFVLLRNESSLKPQSRNHYYPAQKELYSETTHSLHPGTRRVETSTASSKSGWYCLISTASIKTRPTSFLALPVSSSAMEEAKARYLRLSKVCFAHARLRVRGVTTLLCRAAGGQI